MVVLRRTVVFVTLVDWAHILYIDYCLDIFEATFYTIRCALCHQWFCTVFLFWLHKQTPSRTLQQYKISI